MELEGFGVFELELGEHVLGVFALGEGVLELGFEDEELGF